MRIFSGASPVRDSSSRRESHRSLRGSPAGHISSQSPQSEQRNTEVPYSLRRSGVAAGSRPITSHSARQKKLRSRKQFFEIAHAHLRRKIRIARSRHCRAHGEALPAFSAGIERHALSYAEC